MFMGHIPITRVFWMVTLIARVHIWATFIESEEVFLLGLSSIHSLLVRL